MRGWSRAWPVALATAIGLVATRPASAGPLPDPDPDPSLPPVTSPDWAVVVGRGARATDLGVSPDGQAVYVAFASGDAEQRSSAVAAYDASNGSLRWVFRSRRRITENPELVATELAVSPGGRRIVLAGQVPGERRGTDIAIWMLDARTGDSLWSARHAGSDRRWNDEPRDIIFSPDGSRLFVGGVIGMAPDRTLDAFVVAHRVSDGRRLWRRIHTGPHRYTDPEDYPGLDAANALALAHQGRTLIVAGGQRYDMLTMSLNAETGATRWRRVDDAFHGAGTDGFQFAKDVLVRDGLVSIAGRARSEETTDDQHVAAGQPVDGTRPWFETSGGELGYLPVSHGESLTFGRVPEPATFYASALEYGNRFVVDSRLPGNGAARWRTTLPGVGEAYDIELPAGASLVYAVGDLTGGDEDPSVRNLVAMGFDVTTGEVVWHGRITGTGERPTVAFHAVLAPDADRLYAAGESQAGSGCCVQVVAFDP